MTQVSILDAADRSRLIQDALRQRDQQREAAERLQTQSLDENLRQRETAETNAALQAQRIQDRRDIIEGLRADQDQQRDRQRTRDFIDNDTQFVRRQDSIAGDLAAARDSRELSEGLLLRDIAGERTEAAELRTIDQRNDDLRTQQIEREARIVERRLQERADEIRQEQALQRSLNQIRNASASGDNAGQAERGTLLDVSG